MELLIAFAVFLVGTFICMALGWSLSWGLALGLVCFTLVGLRRGLTLRALVRMAWEGARTSLVVLRILVLIGFLTALWLSLIHISPADRLSSASSRPSMVAQAATEERTVTISS